MLEDQDARRLQEIKARVSDATPGRWPNPIYDAVGVNPDGSGGWWFGYDDDEEGRLNTHWAQMERDAEFVAHATRDVVWLVDRLQDALYQEAMQTGLKDYYIGKHREAKND